MEQQIRKSTLDFLRAIRQNNEREWFNLNRAWYEDARDNFSAFIQAVIDRTTRFEPILRGLEAKSCTYRIYRDTRFSNDKTIYKSHMGALIVRGGKQNGNRFAGYYFHLEPDGASLAGGGAYLPPMPWLSAIRTRIAEDGDQFIRIINNKAFKKYFGEIGGEKLKSPPRGFISDNPFIELIKFKSFLASKTLSDDIVTGKECLDQVVETLRLMKPFNDFLNSVYS